MLFSIVLDILPKISQIEYINQPTSWSHHFHQTDDYLLYLIEHGDIYIKEAEQTHHLKKGDVFIFQPNLHHLHYKKAPCSYLAISFKHSRITPSDLSDDLIIQEMINKRQLSQANIHYTDHTAHTALTYLPKHFNIGNKMLLIQIINELKGAADDFGSRLEDYRCLCACKLNEVFIQISREYVSLHLQVCPQSTPRAYKTIQKIIDYLQTDYQKKFTSNTIEQMFELNYDYLNKVFLKFTGYSINNYLTLVRINMAKELLSTTTLKVSDVGYLVGIEDPYYFSRLFKKHVGISPSRFVVK